MLIGYVAVGVIQAGVRFRHAEHFGRLFGPGAVRTSVASRARDVAFGHDPYESLEPRQYGDGRLVRRARDVDAVYLQPPSTANETDEKHQSPDARTIYAILKVRLGVSRTTQRIFSSNLSPTYVTFRRKKSYFVSHSFRVTELLVEKLQNRQYFDT